MQCNDVDVGFYEDRQPTLSKSNNVLLQLNDKTRTISKRKRRKQSAEKKYLAKYFKAARIESSERPVESTCYPWEEGVTISGWKRPLKGKEDVLTKKIIMEKLDQELVGTGTEKSSTSETKSTSLKERKSKTSKRSKRKASNENAERIVAPKLSDVYVRKGNGRFKLSKDKIKKERLRKFLVLRKKYEMDVQKQISQGIEELGKEHTQLSVDYGSAFDDRKMNKEKLQENLRRKVSRFLDDQSKVISHETQNNMNNQQGNEQLIRAQYSRLLCKLLPKPILK
ncbi:hypothetical protein GpartN1_g840.t1 [Galdieria partita]|uniref:Uncharacterized protein n=1 Tax=Galdieria partita TaxID=83374 RepID=A0A9C7PRT2_9RHOD|nr:hypothetical protein GpartN1_g840.t1 [Galdieria partita]